MCQNDGEDKFPSVVAISREDGTFFVGTESYNVFGRTRSLSLYTEFKRLMDSPEPTNLWPHVFQSNFSNLHRKKLRKN